MELATGPRPITRPNGATRNLIAAGAVGPSLFIAMMLGGLVTGHTSGSSSGSGLALTPVGGLVRVLFVITGLCLVGFAAGQWRILAPASRIGTGLLIIAGAAVALSGVFVTDAPGAPATTTGTIHNLLFLVTMVSLAVSFCFNGVKLRRAGLRGALAHSIATTVVAPLLVIVMITVASDPPDPLYRIGAFIETAIVMAVFGWVVVNAVRLLRSPVAGDSLSRA